MVEKGLEFCKPFFDYRLHITQETFFRLDELKNRFLAFTRLLWYSFQRLLIYKTRPSLWQKSFRVSSGPDAC